MGCARWRTHGLLRASEAAFDPYLTASHHVVPTNPRQVTKGAPHIILKLTKDEHVKHMTEQAVHAFGERGIRCLAVARTFPGKEDWLMAGLLTFLDPPRPDTKDTVHKAMAYGVDVKVGRKEAETLYGKHVAQNGICYGTTQD